LAAEPPALAVVGGHEADVVVPLEGGVDDDDGDLAAHRAGDGADERAVVEGRQHDAVDPAAHEAFDLRDLAVPVVFTQGTAPDDLGPHLAGRLDRARMDALPEDVRRALRDDRNLQLPRGGAGGGAAGGPGTLFTAAAAAE